MCVRRQRQRAMTRRFSDKSKRARSAASRSRMSILPESSSANRRDPHRVARTRRRRSASGQRSGSVCVPGLRVAERSRVRWLRRRGPGFAERAKPRKRAICGTERGPLSFKLLSKVHMPPDSWAFWSDWKGVNRMAVFNWGSCIINSYNASASGVGSWVRISDIVEYDNITAKLPVLLWLFVRCCH